MVTAEVVVDEDVEVLVVVVVVPHEPEHMFRVELETPPATKDSVCEPELREVP